jgi:signal peptidase II
LRILFVSLFIILVDQISKFFVKGVNLPALGITIKGMSPRVPIHVIDNFFNLTFIENPGMAFGLEIGSKELRSVFTIFASILIVYFIYKNRHEIFYLRFSLALILGGAIGNLIDRIFYGVIYGSDGLLKGNVVDFFQLNIPDLKIFGKTFYSWPIFNVADIAVTCGFILILIGYKKIFTKKEVEEQKPSDLNVLETNNDVSIPLSSTAVENEKNINEEKPQLPS